MLLYTGDALARYGFGDDHPFGIDRLGAFMAELQRRGLNRQARIMPPVQGEQDDLLLFHAAEYVTRIKNLSPFGIGMLDADTPAFKGMFETTLSIVGSVLDAIKQILSGNGPLAFVPIAGLHHARRDGAAGFCIFNDCGIAIEALRQRHGISRIAYIDIDAHHGDGVFYAFEDDPALCIVDLHEDGRYLYPGTGAADETGRGAARGSKLNIPLRPGSSDTLFLRLWPRIDAFVRQSRPEFILLQAGVDSLFGDPLAHLALTPNSHRLAVRKLSQLLGADGVKGMLVFGGGGYSAANIANGWCALVEEMLIAEQHTGQR